MDKLEIASTPRSPEVIFDADLHYFILSGRSIQEDCDIYYYPIIHYIKEYMEYIKPMNIDKTIIFYFKLLYYNTASIRYLNTIMELIEEISINKKVKVFWTYESDDEYLQEMGEYFIEMYDIDLEMIQIEIPMKKINRKNK